MTAAGGPPVVVCGVIPPGPGGMRDYGELLAADLRRRGRPAVVRWQLNDGARLAMCLGANLRFLWAALRLRRGTSVVWNYAPISMGWRGLPGPGVLFGLVARARGAHVVTVLHELAPRWAGQPWTVRASAVASSALLAPVLAGSDAVVVTTEHRRRRLAPFLRAAGTPLHFLPVFSNFPVPGERPPTGDGFPVVVVDHGADYARPDVVVDALVRLRATGPGRLVLLGSPGPGRPAADRWTDLAAAAGLPDGAVSFTGIVSYLEFSRALLSAGAVVLPNEQGPSCRKGTLAAAVSHGCPVVSVDGPFRWDRLVDEGAVTVVPPDGAALAAALARLRDDPAARAEAGRRAAAFYDEAMSVEVVGAAIAGLLPPGRRPP
ncbi:MAG TPA: glycosyltransferase [Acidimicrobiales bacterium]